MRRVALVTGGAKRIGAAIADRLAGAGYAIVVHGREGGDAEAKASALRMQGAQAASLVGDLADLASLPALMEAVDWVVSFEEDTPQRLIAGILPDLLVKGGDYKPEEIAGSKEVWANGGEVLVLNFEDGCSTTNIIKKIQQDKKG